MFHKIKNDNFIGKYKIDSRICEKIISFHNKRKKKAGVVGTGRIDTTIKKSVDYGVNPEDVFKYPIIKEYFEELSFCLEKYKKKYIYCDQGHNPYLLEGANIQKYKPGEGFYTWHYENNGTHNSSMRRHLVFMTYLNTIPNAGTEWLYQNYKTESIKGLSVIWPSDFTHTHRGIISKTKEKYILTGWLGFK